MKKAILLANIGNSDLGIGEDSIFSPKSASFTGNVYEDSKKRWESEDYGDLDLPILDPTIRKISESFEIQEIILFGTDQETHKKQDTIYIALIAREIICRRYNFDKKKVNVSVVSENPTYYKGLMRFYQQVARNIPEADQIFVSTTGATPQLNISLMLQVFRKFGENVKIAYKPRPEKEALISDIIFEEKKEVARIGAAQIIFDLTETFPPEIKDKETTREKVFKVLDIAAGEKVDIVCLPELCICEEWLTDIEKRYPEMIVIAGSYYDEERHNVCRVIMDSDRNLLPPQFKITPSEFEDPRMCGLGMVSGEKINIYDETPFGKFAVLICRDFGSCCNDLDGKPDIIFVPSYNSARGRFQQLAHSHVENKMAYVVISNGAKRGGTSIFGRMKRSYFAGLSARGFKEEGDSTLKLCELKEGEEGIIIADFNLVHKYFATPTPFDPDEAPDPVKNIDIKLI